MGTAYFSPRLFGFLRELKAHNERAWFEANRDRYETDVQDPMLHFIADLNTQIKRLSPHYEANARPVGGSMFRIYRDIRFSKDKSPYKTHIGAHFRHAQAGKEDSAPGFYLHLEPGRSLGGGGLYHPESIALRKVRDRIVARAQEWKAVRAKVPVEGDSLTRVPSGYDPSHPLASDLKLKDYYVTTYFSNKEVYAVNFMERYVEVCRSAAALMKFLTQSVRLPW